MLRLGVAVIGLIAVLTALDNVCGQQQARAVFNAKAISGYIQFTNVSGGVRIQTHLEGLKGRQRWHVHLFPVDQTVDPGVQCTGDYVGPHYDPFNQNNGTGDYTTRCSNDRTMCEAGDLSGKWGYVEPNVNIDVVDNTSTLFLAGRYSIVGRSIVIHSHIAPYPNFACATIRSIAEIEGTSPVTILQSTFVYPMAGVMYLKQVEGEDVQMWGNMFWVNGMGETIDHNWHIHRFAPGEEFRRAVCNTSGNIGGHYDPYMQGPTSADGYSDACGPDTPEGCEVGDLSGKLGTIDVNDSPTPYSNYSFFFTDFFLNLTGAYGVTGRSIAVHRPNRGGPVVACAPLIESETITLRQYGEGEVSISQTSPFEYTTITNGRTREMTVIQNAPFSPLVLNCNPDSSLVFNDYALTASSGDATPDRFATGALHSRYGGSSGIPSSLQVFNLPVYGTNSSISSLNLRAARNGQNNCSALLPSLTDNNIIMAKATFSGRLRGAIYFIQRNFGLGDAGSDRMGNTLVIVDVYRSVDQSETSGHSWQIVTGATPASGCTTSSPATYNPYNVNTVRMNCSPRGPLGCMMGDLSGKHSSINIGSNRAIRPTYTFVDNNILLSGSFSVIGNSVAVMTGNGGTEVMDCGTITRVYLSQTTLTFTSPRDSSRTRTSLTQALANDINVDASDILMLNIRTTEPLGLQCTETTVKVLGSTQAEANSNAQKSAGRESVLRCGATRSATASALAMTGCLLVVILHLLFK